MFWDVYFRELKYLGDWQNLHTGSHRVRNDCAVIFIFPTPNKSVLLCSFQTTFAWLSVFPIYSWVALSSLLFVCEASVTPVFVQLIFGLDHTKACLPLSTLYPLSWLPISTYLYFWYLFFVYTYTCQQTKTDIQWVLKWTLMSWK